MSDEENQEYEVEEVCELLAQLELLDEGVWNRHAHFVLLENHEELLDFHNLGNDEEENKKVDLGELVHWKESHEVAEQPVGQIHFEDGPEFFNEDFVVLGG